MTSNLSEVVVVNDVAHVNGGGSQVALTSAIALARHGYQVTVFAASGPILPELHSTPNLRLVLTGQHEISNDPSRLRAATQGIWNLQAAKMFAEVLSSLDPTRTIVHAHNWTKALSSSVLKVAIDRSFPLVVTLHDYFAACPIGSFYNHKRNAICELRPLSVSCIRENCDPRNARDKAWRVARQFVQRSIGLMPRGIRHFITLSDLSEAVLASELPAAAKQYRIRNPIDTGDRRPAINVADNSTFVYVGRLSPEKGAGLFARAAYEVGVQALFLGGGDCAAEVARLNPNAEISGWLPHSEVLKRLQQARALVCPSLWYENAPLVIGEAAALGIPAIVADTCAAREHIYDGFTGMRFRSGSVKDLALVLELFKNDLLVLCIGASAYEDYWNSPPNLSQHVAELVRVYEAMI